MFTAETTQQPSPVSHWFAVGKGLASHDVHGTAPRRAATRHPLTQLYTGCPAEDIKHKDERYWGLPKMTVLLADFAEMSLGTDGTFSPKILLLLTGTVRNTSNLYSFLLSQRTFPSILFQYNVHIFHVTKQQFLLQHGFSLLHKADLEDS